MNRNSVLWLGFLWLAAAVMAFAASPVKPAHKARTSSVLVSPTNKVVMAKIAPSASDGRQLFVSYNKGVNWESITWFDNNGQIANIHWSKDGWLAIGAVSMPVNCKITDDNYSESVGVFDSSSRIIYWIDGGLAKPKKDMEIFSNIRWLKPSVIAYRDDHFPMSEYKTYQKAIQLTTKFLAKSKTDYTPKVMADVRTAFGSDRNFDKMAQQMPAKDRALFTHYCRKNREAIKKYFVITTANEFTDRGQEYCHLTLEPDLKRETEIRKKTDFWDSLYFSYNIRTKTFGFGCGSEDLKSLR